MNPRLEHAVILFDIDDTLLDFNSCTSRSHVTWNGSRALWDLYLGLLTESALQHNVRLHLGIASFKPAGGDCLSQCVLDEDDGLGKYFNDLNLVFFTSGAYKSTYAMAPAKAYLESLYQNEIVGGEEVAVNIEVSEDGTLQTRIHNNLVDKRNIIICDDQIENVCMDAISNGYSAVCVGNLSTLELNSQVARIAKAFRAIFEKLGLPVPDVILQDVKSVEYEVVRVEMPKQVANTHLSKISRLPTESIEELKAQGIKGLDEDDAEEDTFDDIVEIGEEEIDERDEQHHSYLVHDGSSDDSDDDDDDDYSYDGQRDHIPKLTTYNYRYRMYKPAAPVLIEPVKSEQIVEASDNAEKYTVIRQPR